MKSDNSTLNESKVGGELRLNDDNNKEKIIDIFKEILEVEELPENENFIELGGDSLMVQTLIIRVEEAFNVELTYQDVIENLTPASLADLIAERALSESSPKHIEASMREYYPMLPSQEHVFLSEQMSATKNLYNIEKCYAVMQGDKPGRLDVNKLTDALNKMVERYEILRTVFAYRDEKFVQTVKEPFSCKVKEIQISEENLQDYLHNNTYEYNLGTLPLFHIDLIRTEQGNEYLSLSIHHIISDGTSMGIFFDALKRFYMGRTVDETLLQFKDYAAFREDEKKSGAYEPDKEYWISKLKNRTSDEKYSLAEGSGIVQNFEGNSVCYAISEALEEKLEAASRANKCSKFVISFAAFTLFMNKFTKVSHIVVGVPSANRKYSETENGIGMYINTLPLVADIHADLSMTDLYAAIGKDYAESVEHGNYYSEEVLNDLKGISDVSQLYSSVFIYQNFNTPKLRLGDTFLKEVYRPIKFAKTDMTFEMYRSEGRLLLNIEYFTHMFKEEDVLYMAREYEKILSVLSDNSVEKVSDVFRLTKKEKEDIIKAGTGPVLKKEFVSFAKRFERSASLHKERVALCDDTTEYTYERLFRICSQIAGIIADEASRGEYVCVYMEHGINQIVAMLGILMAGRGYLPADKMLPLERVSFMLKDADCKLMITDRTCETVPDYTGKRVMFDDLLKEVENREVFCEDVSSLDISEEDFAYMIYTSGSTGKPKGIQVMQKNLVAYIDAFLNEFRLKETDVMMHQASIGFDASVEEIFPILTVGGTIATADKNRLMDSSYVKNYFREKKVTIISVSPHLISEINKYWDEEGIHTFISGGDVLKKEYIDRLVKRAKVYNTYGPTETTVCATYYCVHENDVIIPIGKPILNYYVHILDESGNLCPVGVEGEICIAGDGVTAGYIGRPDLTDKQFEKYPFGKEIMMYHTRDTGILLPDGNIKYTGRCDKQLNIRGFRIETGEVESRLLGYEGIDFAVAVGKEIDSELCLCAYIKGTRKYNVEELRHKLEKELPPYMIPQYFVNIDEVPLNTAGKVDEKRLPNPRENIVLENEYEEPHTDGERKLCAIWESVLNLERVGIGDNFFNIGGQSLKAIQLIGRINEEFGLSKTVEYVFLYKTVKEQALYLTSDEAGTASGIPMAPKKDLYATSYMQKDMYAVQAMDSDNTDYNIVKAFKIEGSLDYAKVEEAASYLANRHEALRTAFVIKGDDVFQKVYDSVTDKKVIFVDKNFDSTEKLLETVNRPFDLSEPGLFRIYFIEHSKSSHTIVLVIHHIISDAVSIGNLFRDFFGALKGEQGEALKLTYKDFSEWQVNAADFSESKKYWNNIITSGSGLIRLPYDKEDVSSQKGGATLHREIPAELRKRINEFASENNLTPYMVYMSVYAIVLFKLTGQKEFLVGTPVVNRNNPELFNVVGVFINTVLQKISIDGRESFSEFAKAVRNNTIESLKHQDYPYYLLKDEVKRNAGEAGGLFNVMFSLIEHENDFTEGSYSEVGDFRVEEINLPMNTSMFELTLEVMSSEHQAFTNYEYRTDLFDEITVRRISDMYLNVLKKVTDNSSLAIDAVEVLTDAEKDRLKEIAKGEKKENGFNHVWEAVGRAALDCQSRPAVRFKDETLTYAELSLLVNEVAYRVMSSKIEEDRPVAVYMDSSAERIACIMGIIKSGHTYLPMDKSWPLKRIEFVLKDSNAGVVFTDNPQEISFYEEIQVIDTNTVKGREDWDFDVTYNPDDTAYIIYTSGSSGTPKGVAVSHRNLASYVQAFLDEFKLTKEDVVLQQASVAFDSSVEEIYPALCVGGCIVVADKETIIDTGLFNRYLKTAGVTVVSVSPFLLNELNNSWDGESIHTFISGGDVLKKQYCSRLIEMGSVYNTYGPTESTVCATYYKLTGKEKHSIPIGHPILNSSVYILDDSLNLVPQGAVGEICVSGNGVTKGYLNNAALTAERFVKNPYEAGKILYKTGDLGRLLSDGDIDYIGRKDSQINMRGYRIELGEIESRLLDYEGISDAVVTYTDEGDGYLCAYIKGSREYAVEEMKKYLGESLPSYMVPAYYVNMEAFPFNSSGKVDKSKLPAPFNLQYHESEYEEPVGTIETTLAEIWSEILKMDKVGRKDNFFDCGGQSLKAIFLCNETERRLGVKLPTSAVFKHPVLFELAECVAGAEQADSALSKADRQKTDFEASMQQKNIYILQSMAEGAVHYNMPAAFEICGDVDIEKIERILNDIIADNAVYRTGFEVIDDCIMQRIYSDVIFKIDYSEDSMDVYDFITSHVKPFDLKRPPLLRCAVMRKAANDYIFVLDIHHIVSDGASIQLLVEDIFRRYNNAEKEPTEYEYIDYSEWQKEYVAGEEYSKHREYWKNVYDEIPEPLDFPTDYKRTTERSYDGNSFEILLDEETRAGVEKWVRDNHITRFIFYYTAFAVLISKYTNQDEFVIGIPTLGRNIKETDRMYGNFVNTLAIKTKIDGAMTAKEVAKAAGDVLSEAYDCQDVPFSEVIASLNVARDSSRNPLFDTMFSYLEEEEEANNSGLEIKKIPLKFTTSKFDFGLDILDEKEAVRCVLNYATDLFKESTMKAFLDRYLIVVRSLIQNPLSEVGKMDILSEKEKKLLLKDYNDTEVSTDSYRPIIDMIFDRFEDSSDKTAVVCGDVRVTYGELQIKTNAFAHKLREAGVKKGDYVPVLMERSAEVVIAICSIMRLGAAFVPLDVNWPDSRLSSVIEEVKAKCVAVNEDSSELGERVCPVSICCDSRDNDEREECIRENVGPEDSLYVIYTSGSTGKPKGVEVYNRGITNRFMWMTRYFSKKACESVIQTTNHMYDSAVWQFFWPLTNGGKTVIPDTSKLLFADYVMDTVEKERVTMIDFVPSVFKNIVRQLNEASEVARRLKSLRCVILGGEEIVPKAVDTFRSMITGVRIFNLYGPTEASIGCICHEVTGKEGDIIPIGKPIDNVYIYILNKSRMLVPAGVTGEIYISGECVAKGYIGDKEKTDKAFVKNPFSTVYNRMYKTGDLAKYNADGEILFLGRADEQVKIRGFRIEPGEIENAIRTAADVSDVKVIVQKADNGEPILCAYYIGTVGEDDLRSRIGEILPYYMVPGFMCRIEEFPISASGKLNKKALPKPKTEMKPEEIFVPSDKTEEKVLSIYRKLLQVQEINAERSFFEQGGNSLLATLLIANINKEFGVSLAVSGIFEESRIGRLSKMISQMAKEEKVPVRKVPDAPFYEASNAQKRMYVLYLLNPDSVDYNMPMLFKIPKGEQIERDISLFMQGLVERHESLRTGFKMVDSVLMQFIDEVHDYETPVIEIAGNLKETVSKVIRPFDLGKDRLIRSYILRGKENEYFFIDTHHIISDGVSVKVMFSELKKYMENIEINVPKYQYRDYAGWQKECMKSSAYSSDRAYWLKQFAKPVVRTEFEHDDYKEEGILKREICFGGDDKAKADMIMSELNITPFMFYLALLYACIHHATDADDISIGTPVSGRAAAEFEDTIGLFVNTVVLRGFVGDNMTFISLLEQTKKTVIEAIEHQNFCFDELVDELKIERKANENPLFDIVYSYETASKEKLRIGKYEIEPVDIGDESIKFGADVSVKDYGDSAVVTIEANNDYICESELNYIAACMEHMLASVSQNRYINIEDLIECEETGLNEEQMEDLDFEFEL